MEYLGIVSMFGVRRLAIGCCQCRVRHLTRTEGHVASVIVLVVV